VIEDLRRTGVGLVKGRNDTLARLQRLAYLKLTEKYQDINPFKFIIYSSRAGDER